MKKVTLAILIVIIAVIAVLAIILLYKPSAEQAVSGEAYYLINVSSPTNLTEVKRDFNFTGRDGVQYKLFALAENVTDCMDNDKGANSTQFSKTSGTIPGMGFQFMNDSCIASSLMEYACGYDLIAGNEEVVAQIGYLQKDFNRTMVALLSPQVEPNIFNRKAPKMGTCKRGAVTWTAGWIRVRAIDGSHVIIDKVSQGVTPLTKDFSIGTHSVKLVADGYEEVYNSSVVVSGGVVTVFAPTMKPNPVCTDSDGGKNIYLKGTVSGSLGSFTDYCNSSNPGELIEYYCISDFVQSNNIQCPNGCENGICKPEKLLNSGFRQVMVHPKNDNIIFAINQSWRLYVSQDAGNSWELSSTMLSSITFDNINASIVYGCGSGNNNVYRSEDGGETFSLVSNLPCRGILADKFISRKIYLKSFFSIGGNAWGLYTSEDGGNTFSFKSFRDSIDVPTEFMNASIGRIFWDIDQDPQNGNIIYITGEDSDHSLYPKPLGSAEAYDPYFVVRTLDGGNTFEPISNGLGWQGLDVFAFVDPAGETQWLVGTEGTGLYKWQEQEREWIPLAERMAGLPNGRQYGGLFDACIKDPKNPGAFYCSRGAGGIDVSYDYGQSWGRLWNSDHILAVASLSLDSTGNTLYSAITPYGGSGGGIFRMNLSR